MEDLDIEYMSIVKKHLDYLAFADDIAVTYENYSDF